MATRADNLSRRFARIPTAAVTDVLDELGLQRQTLPSTIRPLAPEMRTAGYAFPVRGRPRRNAPRERDATLRQFLRMLGAVPADMVKAGFKLIKPTMDLSTNLNLWWNLWNDKYVEGFQALNRWASEYVAFPGEFFRHWVRDFYQDNKLFLTSLFLLTIAFCLAMLRLSLIIWNQP